MARLKKFFGMPRLSVSDGGAVQWNDVEAAHQAKIEEYDVGMPDESLVDAPAEGINQILTYANIPTVFSAIHFIASNAAIVPMRLYVKRPIAPSQVGGPVYDPLQGYASSDGTPRSRESSAVKVSSDLGGIDELDLPGSGQEMQLSEGIENVQLESHPMLSLLQYPNPTMTNIELMYSTFAYLELSGNCYWLLTRNDDGDVTGVYVPMPHKVLPRTSRSGVSHYERTLSEINGGSKVETWDPENVIHFRNFHPVSETMGLAPLRPLVDELMTELYSVEYNKNFFKQGARPGVILSTDQVLSKAVFRRVLAQFKEMYAGYTKAHLPALLESGVHAEEFDSGSRRDMEFMEQRRFSREQILMTLGVRPSLLGLISDVNDKELKAHRLAFWEDTMMYKLAVVAEAIEKRVFPRLHPIHPVVFEAAVEYDREQSSIPQHDIHAQLLARYELRMKMSPLQRELAQYLVQYDTRNVPAMREAGNDESTRAFRLSQAGIQTINELRRDIWSKGSVPWGDEPPLTSPVGAAMARNQPNEDRTLLEPDAALNPSQVGDYARSIRETLGVEAKAARRKHISNTAHRARRAYQKKYGKRT